MPFEKFCKQLFKIIAKYQLTFTKNNKHTFALVCDWIIDNLGWQNLSKSKRPVHFADHTDFIHLYYIQPCYNMAPNTAITKWKTIKC